MFFQSDLDRAAYSIADTAKRSPRDADILAFVLRAGGFNSEAEARAYGSEVRASIKSAFPGNAHNAGPVWYVVPMTPTAQRLDAPQGGQGALFDVAPGASAQQDPAQDVLSDRAGNATSPVGHAISAGLITAAQVDALRAFRPALTPDFVAAHVAIANAYEALPQYDPAAIPAYRALAAETERQYRAITGEGGLRVTAWRGEGEPYASSQEMLADIKRGHIYFFTTEAGFGTENGGAAFDERNPLLVGTNVTVVDTNGEPHTMLVNDMFRVVHDYIAHGVTESSFGPLGEERAWAAHMATIEHPDARRALTTETRGQNSWVNFGPHIRRADGTVPTRGDADFVPQQNRPFAPQKTALLPDDVVMADAPSQAPAPTPVQVQTSTAANILTNTPATPAGNIALVRNPKTRREGLRKYASMLKTALVSGLTPVEEAIDNIPARLSAHRDALMAAMWNAPDRRDYMLDLAMRNYGGNDLMRKLGEMATRRKVSAETVQQEVGYYLTAVYAQTKAQRMMEADQQAVDEATLALRKAKTPAAKATAQKALDAATKIRDDRAHAYATGDETTAEHFGPGGERAQEELKAAIAELDALRVDPNASDADIAAADMRVATARADLEQHRVGLVAGMPEAQVLKTIAAARAKYGRAALDSAARDMYRLMAFRTAIDLESGRLQVDTAKLYSPEMEEVEAEMRALVDGVNDPRTTPAKMEVLRRALVNKLAATSTYVPTTGSPDAKPDTDVFGSGTRAPNVATEKRLEGRSSGRAQDGIAAGMSAIYRASSGYGWRPFTGGIEALYHAATTDERQAMGMGTPSPITALQRLGDNVIIHGKWGYKFGGDEVMQALRRENEDGRSAIVKAIALPTQAMAYMMTQLSPPFAVKNMIRDVWERTENLRARELKDANGKVLDSDKIAREALGIAMRGKMFNEIRKFMWSGEGANSEGARYLQEATAAGFGGSRRVHQLPNTRRDLKGEIEHAMSKPARAFSALKEVAERWNMLFDNVAPLSIYIAMRKAGMTKEQAAFQTKDLMNFRKQGASMAFPRAIWAFAQPAATGAHQLLRSLNTRRGLVRATAYVAGFWAIQSMLAAMGGDDDELKRKRTDLLDEFTRDRALGIPLPDGGMAKLPVGMGYPAIANSIANILRGSPLGSGEKEWRDVATDLINRSILPAFSPLDDSKIAGDDAPAAAFVQTLAPTAFEPIINVAIGRTSFGKKIVREEFLDPDVNKALQGAPNTAEFYKDVAKTILQISGGTVDYAPEEVKALFSGYAVGLPREALKFAVTNKTLEQMGKEANVPILDSFYMASNPNAVFGELSAFDERGMTLVKRMTRELPDDISDKDRDDEIRNRLHTLENPRDRRELELYLDYREVKNGFRDEASALTKSGVAKGSGPERDALQHERGQANVLFLNRWYDVRSRD